jgi:hypothetical protein
VEAAEVTSKRRETIHRWIKEGLPVISGGKILIRGSDLKTFCHKKNMKHRKTCAVTEFYCLKCREARLPANNTVSLSPPRAGIYSAKIDCSVCGTSVSKFANQVQVDEISAVFTTLRPKKERLTGTVVHLDNVTNFNGEKNGRI